MAKFSYADAYVSSTDKMPKKEHWAIITNSCRDDGYGGTDPIVEYAAFFTEEKWLEQIEYLETKESAFKEKYVALKVNPVKIKKTITVKYKGKVNGRKETN